MNIVYRITISHDATPVMKATLDVRNDHELDNAVLMIDFHSSRLSSRYSSL